MRPDDLWKSDVGPWPSRDGPAVTCGGCGQHGTRDLIARNGLCWSCWARAWAGATEAVLDRPRVQQIAGSSGATKKGERMNETMNRTQRQANYEDYVEIIADYIQQENADGRYVAVAQVVNLAEVLNPNCDPAMVLVDVHDLLEERGR
jgi:hypothetical protein